MGKKKERWFAIIALVLSALACTCGPLSQVQQVAEDAQQVATQVGEAAPTVAAIATAAAEFQTGDGELPAISGTEPLPPDFDACALLTAETIQATMGADVTQTSPMTPSESLAGCTYTLATNANAVLSVTVASLADASAATNVIDTTRQGMELVASVATPEGAWNAAVYVDVPDSNVALFHFASGSYVVQMTLPKAESSQQQAEQLASTIIGQLP